MPVIGPEAVVISGLEATYTAAAASQTFRAGAVSVDTLQRDR